MVLYEYESSVTSDRLMIISKIILLQVKISDTPFKAPLNHHKAGIFLLTTGNENITRYRIKNHPNIASFRWLVFSVRCSSGVELSISLVNLPTVSRIIALSELWILNSEHSKCSLTANGRIDRGDFQDIWELRAGIEIAHYINQMESSTIVFLIPTSFWPCRVVAPGRVFFIHLRRNTLQRTAAKAVLARRRLASGSFSWRNMGVIVLFSDVVGPRFGCQFFAHCCQQVAGK